MTATELSLSLHAAGAVPDSASPQRLSVIVPCFNEAESLGRLVGQLKKLKAALEGRYDVELVLIDDGSSDDTWRLLHEQFEADGAARLIRHDSNRGIAAAIATGLVNASAEIAASLDADCTYEALQLVGLLELMDSNVDLVVASPYHPWGRVVGVPAWRLALSKLASRLYRAVMRSKLHTYTSCVRIYRRSTVIDLRVRRGGFVGVVELLWQVDRRGGRIVECPAVLTVRTTGQSKMRVARVAMGHLGLLAEAVWDRLFGVRTGRTLKSVESISSQTSSFAPRTI